MVHSKGKIWSQMGQECGHVTHARMYSGNQLVISLVHTKQYTTRDKEMEEHARREDGCGVYACTSLQAHEIRFLPSSLHTALTSVAKSCVSIFMHA